MICFVAVSMSFCWRSSRGFYFHSRMLWCQRMSLWSLQRKTQLCRNSSTKRKLTTMRSFQSSFAVLRGSGNGAIPSKHFQDKCQCLSNIVGVNVGRNNTSFSSFNVDGLQIQMYNVRDICKRRTPSPFFKNNLQNRLYHTIGYRLCSSLLIALSQKRHISSGSTNFDTDIRSRGATSRLAAEKLVRGMSDEERKRVKIVLQDLEQELLLENGYQEQAPNFNQLWICKFWIIYTLYTLPSRQNR